MVLHKLTGPPWTWITRRPPLATRVSPCSALCTALAVLPLYCPCCTDKTVLPFLYCPSGLYSVVQYSNQGTAFLPAPCLCSLPRCANTGELPCAGTLLDLLCACLQRNTRVERVDLSRNARLALGTRQLDELSEKLLKAVSRFEDDHGTSAVVHVGLDRTGCRPAEVKRGVCTKSSFEAELKRHIDVRRVRANDPGLARIDWSEQGIGNTQVHSKRDKERNLLKALENNTVVRHVDLHGNPKVTKETEHELEVRTQPTGQPAPPPLTCAVRRQRLKRKKQRFDYNVDGTAKRSGPAREDDD